MRSINVTSCVTRPKYPYKYTNLPAKTINVRRYKNSLC